MTAVVPSGQPNIPQQQLQTPYEACLYGSVTGQDEFQSVFNRLVLKTDNGALNLHIRELVFKSQSAGTIGIDDRPLLICRQDLLGGDQAGW